MFFHSKIQQNFTFWITGLIFFIMIIVTLMILFREQHMIEEKVFQKGQVLVNTLAETAEDPLIKTDYPALKDFVDQIVTDKEIAYVYIFEDATKRCVAYVDQNGNRTYEGASYNSFSDPLSVQIFKSTDLFYQKHVVDGVPIIDISKPVTTGETQYGIVRIGMSLENLNKELNHTTWVVLGIAIFAIFIGAIFAWFLTRTILRPLNEIMKSLNLLSGGDFSHRIELKAKNEFKTLADNFNKMISNIDTLYYVSNVMSFSSDTDNLVKIILNKALEALNAEHGSLMLLDEHEQYLEAVVIGGVTSYNKKEEFVKIPFGKGVAGTVAKNQKGMIIPKGHNDERFEIFGKDLSYEENIKSLLCVPLHSDEKTLGVINIVNKKNGEEFNDTDLRFMEVLASHASTALSKAKLYEKSITDGLTKLFIHVYFQNKLEEEIKRANRYHTKLSLLMLDIDHFKKFNDTYGHQQGDNILVNTAALIKDSIRDVDVACRYGGEEFSVIMPETDHDGAFILAERLRKKIESHEFSNIKDNSILHVTVSIGISTFPFDAITKDELITKADQALYTAKGCGRNRVIVSYKGT